MSAVFGRKLQPVFNNCLPGVRHIWELQKVTSSSACNTW